MPSWGRGQAGGCSGTASTRPQPARGPAPPRQPPALGCHGTGVSHLEEGVVAARGELAVAEKAKEQASQLGEAAFSGAGNIAAATGLVKKEEFPADLKPEEVAQEAVEEPLVEPLLEPEGESYEEPPQQEGEPCWAQSARAEHCPLSWALQGTRGSPCSTDALRTSTDCHPFRTGSTHSLVVF
uniref:Beta-synuclein n=1 Tax=Anser brachyrhynchus TaxID=132585 RepID=A0A8B9I9G6_9AVES